MADVYWAADDDVLVVEKDGRWGYVDRSGSLIIPCKYDSATQFLGNYACVSKTSGGTVDYYIIDKNGKTVVGPKDYEVIPWRDGFFIGRKGSSHALLDGNGSQVTDFAYRSIDNCGEGFFVVSVTDGKSFFQGLIDKNGTEIVPLDFDFVAALSEAKYLVSGGGAIGLLTLP